MRSLDRQGLLFLTDWSANLDISEGKPSKHALRDAYPKMNSHA
jgi:hypothetical protein